MFCDWWLLDVLPLWREQEYDMGVIEGLSLCSAVHRRPTQKNILASICML